MGEVKMASNCSWLEVATRNPHKGYDLAHNSHWMDLPIDVLMIIGGKLVDIEDYIRFGAICTSWRTVLWLIREKIPPQLPVFMFPNILTQWPPGTEIVRHNFFSSTGSNHGVSPMRQYIENCFGVSHGWLLIRCGRVNKASIQLLNPFSSVNNVIKFPDLPEDVSVRKGVLSHNPTLTSNFVVMVIYYSGKNCGLAFIKPGDESWNHLYPHEVKHALQTLIFYKDQFYAMNDSGEVFSCDITGGTIAEVASSPVQYVRGASAMKAYLVESSGDLLWVKREFVRKIVDGMWFNNTVGFCIFKFQTTGRKWTQLNTLGGQALFLSEFSSISLLGLDFSQCEPNHIYFLGDMLSDAGVFNLEDASFKLQVTFERISLRCQYPIWVQPTLDMSNRQEVSVSRVQCEHAYYTRKSFVVDEEDDIRSHERGYDSPFNTHQLLDEMIDYFFKNPPLREKAILRDRIRNTVPFYENFMSLWSSNKSSKAAYYPLRSSGDGRLTMAIAGPEVVEEPNITQFNEDLEDSEQHGIISSWEVQKEDSRTLHLEGENVDKKVTAKAAIRAKKKAKKKLRKLKKRVTKMTEDGSISSSANPEEKTDAENETLPSDHTKYTFSGIEYTQSKCIRQCKMYPNWLLVAPLMFLATLAMLYLEGIEWSRY